MVIGQLLIQVQPDLAPSLPLSAFKSQCEVVASEISGLSEYQCEEGHENGPFLNLHFAVSDPISAWTHIRQSLYESADFGEALKAASMAMCTGEAGWADYVLLYHYDPNVPCVPIYTP